jgi:membrane peptidoglycan carboxypeptidase
MFILPPKRILRPQRKTSRHEREYLVVRDYNDEYHGEIDLKTAFAKSCNHVFAQLAMEVGADRLKRVAKELGVGDDFL